MISLAQSSVSDAHLSSSSLLLVVSCWFTVSLSLECKIELFALFASHFWAWLTKKGMFLNVQ